MTRSKRSNTALKDCKARPQGLKPDAQLIVSARLEADAPIRKLFNLLLLNLDFLPNLISAVLQLSAGASSIHQRQLRQSSIQMRVAPIDKNVLSGNVCCLGRKQKDCHRCDFLRQGHALAQWHLRNYGLQFLFRIREGVEPLAIERRHYFRWNDGIDPDAVGKKLGGPFAGQGENGSFGGGVA